MTARVAASAALVLLTASMSSTHAQSISPDGSTLIPRLTNAAGTWTFGAPFDNAGNFFINLNGQPALGAASSKLVVANGGNLYALSTQGTWFMWANGVWAPSAAPGAAVVLRVGPSEQYRTVRSAIDVANADRDPGIDYIIQIASGTYRNDFAEIFRPVVLEAAPGAAPGSVILEATTTPNNGKAIFVAWANLTVRGLTFRGAANSNSNGAGIRDHNFTPNGTLTIENSVFRGNQTGVLTDPNANSLVITISHSSFVNNGGSAAPTRNPHALYVNSGASLTVSDSLFCGQVRGHNIKSRAQATTITGNRLYDGAANAARGCNAGSTSLAIDISNGGRAVISGNTIIQGPASPNFGMVSYGAEGLRYRDNSLIVSNNSFSNTAQNATALRNPHCVTAQLSNNTFTGIPTIVNPSNCATQ